MAKIAIYAFSTSAFFFKEVYTLLNKRNIDATLIFPRGTFLYEFGDILKNIDYLYLYENFDLEYANKEDVEFLFSDDTIYKILEADKSETNSGSYKSLNKDVQLKIIKIIYKIYKIFLLKTKPNYILFPDVETVDGLILLNLAYELKIEPIYYVHTRYMGKSFFSNSVYETLPSYYGSYTNQDYLLAEELLKNFSSLSSNYKIKDWIDSKQYKIHLQPLVTRMMEGIKRDLTTEKLFKGEGKGLAYRVKTNIVPLLEVYRRTKFSFMDKKKFDIQSDNDLYKLPKKFVFFALQVTPESSINSLEPYFIDQLRAIDLLRLNLPNNFYLVVKEHPSMIGIRDSSFYKTLTKKAGIVLVNPNVNTWEIINRAKLTATITGTIAFECFIHDKAALLFGPNFFSHLVYTYDSYKNLKLELERMIFAHKPMSKKEKIIELAKIYNITYNTFLFEPIMNAIVMEKQNIENYIFAIEKHIQRLEEYNCNKEIN